MLFKNCKEENDLNFFFHDRHIPLQMIFSKVTEIVAEAIPAGCLQMYAFVDSSDRSAAAAGSILISALTTGFGSALISYGKFILRCSIVLRIVSYLAAFSLIQTWIPLQRRDERPLSFMVLFLQLGVVSSSS